MNAICKKVFKGYFEANPVSSYNARGKCIPNLKPFRIRPNKSVAFHIDDIIRWSEENGIRLDQKWFMRMLTLYSCKRIKTAPGYWAMPVVTFAYITRDEYEWDGVE
jgi:hypothetical protein